MFHICQVSFFLLAWVLYYKISRNWGFLSALGTRGSPRGRGSTVKYLLYDISMGLTVLYKQGTCMCASSHSPRRRGSTVKYLCYDISMGLTVLYKQGTCMCASSGDSGLSKGKVLYCYGEVSHFF